MQVLVDRNIKGIAPVDKFGTPLAILVFELGDILLAPIALAFFGEDDKNKVDIVVGIVVGKTDLHTQDY